MSTERPGERTCRYRLDDKGTECGKLATEENNRFCVEHSNWPTDDLEEYKIVAEKFNRELDLFWTRANFYFVVHAALLSVAVTILTDLSLSKPETLHLFETPTRAKNLLVVGGVCLVGGVLSVFWLMVLGGTYHWINEWRGRVTEIELKGEVNRFKSFATAETKFKDYNLLRPARITRWLPGIFILGWILLDVWVIWIAVVFAKESLRWIVLSIVAASVLAMLAIFIPWFRQTWDMRRKSET
jgi:hypothetical protein